MAKKSITIDKEQEFTLRALAVKDGVTQEEYLQKVIAFHLEKNKNTALSAFELHLQIQEKEIKERSKKQKKEEHNEVLEGSNNEYETH